MSPLAGTLYVIATPIGNRDDISARALKTLSEVDLIAAEDTRNSGSLMAHFGISTPLTALHEHNERSASSSLIEKLKSGRSIGLISDAGTPGISDPGTLLVDAALAAGIRVVPIPGASAQTALLSVCGLGPGPALFYGFLPPKSGARERALEKLRSLQATLVFYEAPHRIEACLAALSGALGGNRRVVIGRELTKLFETVHRTTLEDAQQWLAEDANHRRGEFVLAVEGAPADEGPDPASCDRLLKALLEKLSVGDAVRVATEATGLGRKTLYERALILSERR
ncbi:MAG: 16S rRNA (cytidine(1402)-2'-O)-methyltransferase [Betaproteobacteria bacterium]|nr:16S rRNA (cytidine(1402)-2'-O)-methyltransferase [Betaproteobacteria bacterium]MDE2621602.1 16S rRNA (cytidine(1402)-2'-O)-methyltransferase [Betaproteobacteria bacterium]